MDIEHVLSQKLNIAAIKKLSQWFVESCETRKLLWEFAHSQDRRISLNALWVMTHLPHSECEWLLSLQNEMIDNLLCESDTGKKRMLLQLLKNQKYDIDHIRTDFLDYCMSKINSESESYAIRCFSIYIAFKICSHYPELIAELEGHLDMVSFQTLSPGLKSALRQTKEKIAKLRQSSLQK